MGYEDLARAQPARLSPNQMLSGHTIQDPPIPAAAVESASSEHGQAVGR
ncbi:hypothetical protein [Nocardia macrotermitis]|uniref:Uncharacterized protein n=1 Tax=Nocardia macrotermitis TaxID=2585198 RepID=A0A7K0D7C0_9NOCA|nr:hypothetical protein [Nocardia macrotermitis]MQY21653.1 hypothetical protein [Nocardia macrotermitis]